MSDETPSSIKFIDRELRRIEIDLSGLNISFPLNAIPDSIYEAADAGVELIVCLTEGIPV